MSGSLPATGPPPLPPQPLTGRDPSCEDAADTSQPSPPATQQVVPGLSNIHQDRDRAACFFESDHCLSLFGSSILLHSNSIHTLTASPSQNYVYSFVHLLKSYIFLQIKSIQLVPSPPPPAIITQPSVGVTRLQGGVIALNSAAPTSTFVECAAR